MFGLLVFVTLACDSTDGSAVAPQLTVSDILSNWECASHELKTAKLEITRTVYNLVFMEERVSSA